jgi:hypothetical protein
MTERRQSLSRQKGQRITRPDMDDTPRGRAHRCWVLVRSHPLCPLSYGRALHAQTERKTGRDILAQRSASRITAAARCTRIVQSAQWRRLLRMLSAL